MIRGFLHELAPPYDRLGMYVLIYTTVAYYISRALVTWTDYAGFTRETLLLMAIFGLAHGIEHRLPDED